MLGSGTDWRSIRGVLGLCIIGFSRSPAIGQGSGSTFLGGRVCVRFGKLGRFIKSHPLFSFGPVLVGRTELSYTYAQTPKEGTPYNLYHGTLEARPVTPTTSKIVYTLFFDNSMLPDDTAQPAARAEPQELSQRLAVDCAERAMPPAQLPLPGAERAEAAGRPARMQMPLAEPAARVL